MVRKPYPKEAAARVREFLARDGIELSPRKSLEIVALVESHNSWQAMWAHLRANASQARAAQPKLTAYEQLWKSLLPLIVHKMGDLCFVLRGNVAADLRVIDPGEEHERESRVAFRIERLFGQPVLYLSLALVENEDKAGEFALRLSVDGSDGTELWNWFLPSAQPFTRDSGELRKRLQQDFDASTIVLSLYETKARSSSGPGPVQLHPWR